MKLIIVLKQSGVKEIINSYDKIDLDFEFREINDECFNVNQPFCVLTDCIDEYYKGVSVFSNLIKVERVFLIHIKNQGAEDAYKFSRNIKTESQKTIGINLSSIIGRLNSNENYASWIYNWLLDFKKNKNKKTG